MPSGKKLAVLALSLFLLPVIMGIAVDHPASERGGYIDTLLGGGNGNLRPSVTRYLEIESDDSGGSWFNGLQNGSGIERMDNCSLDENGIRLEGAFPADTWYYEDWQYRRELVIENPASVELSGYQLNMDVEFIPGMMDNFDDLRFTYFDTATGDEESCAYWIEERMNSKNARVWINASHIHAEKETTLFMYYGNPLAVSESSGEGTFLFFDDFNGEVLDTRKWHLTRDTDHKRECYVTDGNLYLYVHDTWDSSLGCKMKESRNIDDTIVEMRQRVQSGGTKRSNSRTGLQGLWLSDVNVSWDRKYGRSDKESAWLKYGSEEYTENTIWSEGTWNGSDTGYHVLGFEKKDDLISLHENSELVTSIQEEGITMDAYWVIIHNIVYGYVEDGWGKQWTDWFRIRNHVTLEPTVSFRGTTGEALSTAITLPVTMKWDTFAVGRSEPEGSSVIVDILDSETGGPIPGFEGITTADLDISGLNDLGLESIQLHVRLTGNAITTPVIHSWGIEWRAEKTWRDSFIGTSKVYDTRNVRIFGDVEMEDAGKEATLRSVDISLPENMSWDQMMSLRSVPDGATVKISVHDAKTDEMLFTDNGDSDDVHINLSSLDPRVRDSIYLRAELSTTAGPSPILHHWSVRIGGIMAPPTAYAGDDISIDQFDTAYFDAGDLYSGLDTLEYSWSFSHGGMKQVLQGRTTEFRFDHAGVFTVTLTVSDAFGNRGTDELVVTVRDITPPTADAGPDGKIDQNGSFTFLGSDSADNVGIVSYTWTFEYLDEAVFLYGMENEFTFAIPGYYVVILTVRDQEGNWGEDTMTLTVHDITKPVADAGEGIVASPGERIHLNGTGSWDNVGIENYTWLFFNDGSVVSLYGENNSIVIDTPGEYVITLIVSDLENNIGTDNLSIIILEGKEGQTGGEEGAGEEENEEEDADGDGYDDATELAAGSDPDDPDSTPLDLDGDGVPNERDAYPHDPDRWAREDEGSYVLWVIIICGAGLVIFIISYFAYSRINSGNLLNHETRWGIFSYINENPGRHFRELTRRLDVNRNTLSHHINKLEKAGLLTSHYDGYYKRYYPLNSESEYEVFTPVQERIIGVLRENPGITYKGQIEKTDKTISTLSYHMRSLVDKGVVKKVRRNKKLYLYLSRKDV